MAIFDMHPVIIIMFFIMLAVMTAIAGVLFGVFCIWLIKRADKIFNQ